jgi:hypothetical protein
MATNNQLNILILCADNITANLKPTKLHNNITYIVDKYFKNELPLTQNIYYMGDKLTNDLANNKCNSTTDDLINTCGYKHSMFDIILSEFCPLFVYTPNFFNNIKNLLNENGIYSFLAPRVTKLYLPNTKILNYTPDEFLNNIKQYSLLHIENYNAQRVIYTGNTVTNTWSIIKKANDSAVIDDKLNTKAIVKLNTEHNTSAKKQKFGNTKLRVANEITQQMQPNLINFISLGK